MAEKLRNFVREAGIVITIFVVVPGLTLIAVSILPFYYVIHTWWPVAEKLASLR
jgi:hypothetical protein